MSLEYINERLKELRRILGMPEEESPEGDGPDPTLTTDEALEFTSLVFLRAGMPEHEAFNGLASDPASCHQIGLWLSELLDRRHGTAERRMKMVAVQGETSTHGTIFPVGADGRFMLVRNTDATTAHDVRELLSTLAQETGMTAVIVHEKYGKIDVMELVHVPEGCTCAQIQESDAKRHFKGCPLREENP